MITHERTQSGHTKRFIVSRGAVGWDVREEDNAEVVRTATYTDWHRVERALQVFDLFDHFDLDSPRAPHSTNR
ncbi:MAG: hypothetical protein ABI652_05525 [Acidobacteriota bacterium]